MATQLQARNSWRRLLTVMAGPSLVALLAMALAPDAQGFRRYQDGCNDPSCHGAFNSATTTKGSVFLSDSKHEMHRSSSEMNTDCDMCHTTGDQRNPYIGSSNDDGFGGTPGPGCTGCHNGRGLRRHHNANGQTFCFDCHTNAAPPSEDTPPPYYSSSLTRATSPCNSVAAAQTGENWTTNDFIGLDNDGDNVYDSLDTDCASPVGAGRLAAGSLSVSLAAGGDLELSWGGSCLTGDDDYQVYEGVLEPFSPTRTFTSHQFVYCTTSGATTAQLTPTGDFRYYLVVPTNGVVEGSYGMNSDSVERPQGMNTCAVQTMASCP